MYFFTPTDLNQLQEVAGTTFDKDNPAHLRRERELSAGAWAKTEYWLKQVAKRTSPLFETGIRKNVRRQAGTKKKPDGSSAMNLRFKPFTWGKLYPKGTERYRIFFTVGIDAQHPDDGPCLVWRPGCQNNGSEALPEAQRKRFEAFMDKEGAGLRWQTIYLNKLDQWDWEANGKKKGLLDATAAFITDPANDFLPTYAGPQGGDLDVIAASGTFDGSVFRFSATLNGLVGTTPGAFYVWGLNRGAGTQRFVTGTPSVGQGVFFDAVVIARPNLTGAYNDLVAPTSSNTLAPGSVTVTGSTISVEVPASLVTSEGFAVGSYTWNLWPRVSTVAGNAAISDFAPDASNAALTVTTPAPPAVVLLAAGAGLLGVLRRRLA